jgi:ankyrin repeat protein
LTSEPILHFQQHQTWPPGLHLSADNSQHISSSNLAESRTLRENLVPPYLDPDGGLDFAANQSLHDVISHGTEEEITNLLSSGISVNIRDTLNNSPLHTAISRGDIGIVKSLLNYGANVDDIGFKGKTALHLAVGSIKMVKLLLKHQPSLQIQDEEGNTVLHYMLLIKDWWEDCEATTTMKTMLSYGVDVNITNKIGESPLHRLVADVTSSPNYRYLDMVLEFLHHEPDVRSPMRNGLNLFALFLDNSDILSRTELLEVGFRCMEKFLMAGADSNIVHRSSPLLHYYLENGNIFEGGPWKPFLSLLLQTAKLEEVEPHGDYPLHVILSRYPYWNGKKRAISAITASLIAQNANVNQKNRAGAAPLETLLSRTGHRPDTLEVTLLLIKAGAATTTFTSTGNTLFDLAAQQPEYHRTSLIKSLLEGDISSPLDDTDIAARPEWVGVWRRALKQRLWRLSKLSFVELEQFPSLPKNTKFGECAFVVIAEHHLKRHMAMLKIWQGGDYRKESVKEDYEEYCAILRDCRERNAEIDPSWYKSLLDLMDFT